MIITKKAGLFLCPGLMILWSTKMAIRAGEEELGLGLGRFLLMALKI